MKDTIALIQENNKVIDRMNKKLEEDIRLYKNDMSKVDYLIEQSKTVNEALTEVIKSQQQLIAQIYNYF